MINQCFNHSKTKHHISWTKMAKLLIQNVAWAKMGTWAKMALEPRLALEPQDIYIYGDGDGWWWWCVFLCFVYGWYIYSIYIHYIYSIYIGGDGDDYAENDAGGVDGDGVGYVAGDGDGDGDVFLRDLKMQQQAHNLLHKHCCLDHRPVPASYRSGPNFCACPYQWLLGIILQKPRIHDRGQKNQMLHPVHLRCHIPQHPVLPFGTFS